MLMLTSDHICCIQKLKLQWFFFCQPVLWRLLGTQPNLEQSVEIIIIIIIIRAFVRRTMSASELNLRRRQSLGGEDG